MPAEWKKTPLERAKRKTPIQDRDQRIAELEAKLINMHTHLERAKYERDHYADMARRFEAQRNETNDRATMFDWLKKQELMLATKDGFTLVKGDELEEHCRANMFDAGVSERYKQALARSMQRMTHEMSEEISKVYKYVSYPGSQS